MISKTHMSGQKPHGRQLNAKALLLHLKEILFIGLGLTVTEINKKVQKQDLKKKTLM